MINVNKVSVAELADANGLIVYSGGMYLKERFITTSDISRPGLELTGYFDYYPEERVQLMGMTAISSPEPKRQSNSWSAFPQISSTSVKPK